MYIIWNEDNVLISLRIVYFDYWHIVFFDTYAETVSMTLVEASLIFFMRFPAPPFNELNIDPAAVWPSLLKILYCDHPMRIWLNPHLFWPTEVWHSSCCPTAMLYSWKERCWIITPISTKQTTTSNLKSLDTKTMTSVNRNHPMRIWLNPHLFWPTEVWHSSCCPTAMLYSWLSLLTGLFSII
jgi:hypothetical protein